MSREIKFRAWDCKYKCMDYNFFISNLGGVFGEPEKYYDTPNIEIDEAPNLTVMQYTGLKDKSGKELYDGDIYSQWSEVCKCDFEQVIYEKMNCLIFEGDFEIIGNIYENPELLKANK